MQTKLSGDRGPSLIDGHGRQMSDLRVSVTDRCNLRCAYCTSVQELRFVPRDQILHFAEIARLVAAAAGLGIRKVRLTGGEPLVRRDLAELAAMLVAIPGVEEVPITTNGVQLASQAEGLYAAGVRRLNISLDTLRRDRYEEICGRDAVERVLAGIDLARALGFAVRVNMVPMRGFNDDEILPMARWAAAEGLHIRFIECMPFAGNGWSAGRLVTAAEIRRRLATDLILEPGQREHQSAPAVDQRVVGSRGKIGVIASVSEPFCDRCSRMRLTAEGRLRPCLHSDIEVDVRTALRRGASARELVELFQTAATAKPRGHGDFLDPFARPAAVGRSMLRIGG